jgi:hypothetical protein
MRERCDADRILRWVFRQAYGLRNPSTDQLRNYQHWHAVSRRDGFDGLEPPDWRDWPWRPVPPGVTPLAITQPEPASPETISAQCAQMPETIDEVSTGAQCAPVPPPRQRERQSAQAEKVREQMRADELRRPLRGCYVGAWPMEPRALIRRSRAKHGPPAFRSTCSP